MKRLLLILLVFSSLVSSGQTTRKLFGLNINNTPPDTRRIAFGEVGESSENMTLSNLYSIVESNLDVYNKTEIDGFFANYLAKDNLTVYTPTLDYHPATKVYVDRGFDNVNWSTVTAGANVNLFNVRVSQANGVVYLSGRYESTSNSVAGKIIFTLPLSITPPQVPIEFGATNRLSQNNEGNQLYIDTGSRDIRLRVDGDNGWEYSFNISYPLF